jgi:hypothetical protein
MMRLDELARQLRSVWTRSARLPAPNFSTS